MVQIIPKAQLPDPSDVIERLRSVARGTACDRFAAVADARLRRANSRLVPPSGRRPVLCRWHERPLSDALLT